MNLTELDQSLRELGYALVSDADDQRLYARRWRDRKDQEHTIYQVVDAVSVRITRTRSHPAAALAASTTQEQPMAKQQQPTNPAPTAKPRAKRARAEPTSEAVSTERPATRIRALILAGRTNEEIIEELQLPASKRHYPGWYRSQLKRKGLVP